MRCLIAHEYKDDYYNGSSLPYSAMHYACFERSIAAVETTNLILLVMLISRKESKQIVCLAVFILIIIRGFAAVIH